MPPTSPCTNYRTDSEDLPTGPLCVTADRATASIATSLLDRAGVDVVLIDDLFAKAGELGLTAP